MKKAPLSLSVPEDAVPPLDTPNPTVVHQLAPEFDELRQKLEEALEIAKRIDQARGRSYPEAVGGSRGYDLAEEVNQLLARVELAAGGSAGKGLE